MSRLHLWAWWLWNSPTSIVIRIAFMITWRILLKLGLLVAIAAVGLFAAIWLVKYLRAGSNWARVWQGGDILGWCRQTLHQLTDRLMERY